MCVYILAHWSQWMSFIILYNTFTPWDPVYHFVTHTLIQNYLFRSMELKFRWIQLKTHNWQIHINWLYVSMIIVIKYQKLKIKTTFRVYKSHRIMIINKWYTLNQIHFRILWDQTNRLLHLKMLSVTSECIQPILLTFTGDHLWYRCPQWEMIVYRQR